MARFRVLSPGRQKSRYAETAPSRANLTKKAPRLTGPIQVVPDFLEWMSEAQRLTLAAPVERDARQLHHAPRGQSWWMAAL